MHTYRASELGGCIKRSVAGRLNIKKKETPDKMLQVFSRGDAHEEACVAVMLAQGWSVTDQQKEVILPINDDCQVMGHLDGLTEPPDIAYLHKPVLEIKSPTSWQAFLDNQYNPEPPFLIQRYLWQLSVYMVCEEREALLVTLDDYNIRFHGIELPPYSKEQIVQRVLDIEAQAKVGLPPYCNVREFPCPYYHLHEDELGDDEDPFDVELHEIAVEYAQAQGRAKHAKSVLDRLMADRDSYRNGEVRITRSVSHRKTTNYKRLLADHNIDPTPYQRESEVTQLRVTYRGDDSAID